MTMSRAPGAAAGAARPVDHPAPSRLDEPVRPAAARTRHTIVVLAVVCVVLAVTEPVLLVAAGWDPLPLALWESILVLFCASWARS